MIARNTLSLALAAGLLLAAVPASAGMVDESFDFQLGEWHELDSREEPIVLHRLRLDRIEGRLTKSALARPHNQNHLETVRLQLEYTNEADRKWNARITVNWLDEDGKVIDGFSANETLSKRSARKIVQFSVSTLSYGLEKADSLEVEIHYEP